MGSFTNSEFFSAGFTEEAEEAETDGAGVKTNKPENLLLSNHVSAWFVLNGPLMTYLPHE